MTKAVSVTIVNNAVTVDQPTLHMGGGANQQIQWNIPSSQAGGWTFPQNGIAFDANDGQFTGATVAEQGRRFIWHDANSNGGSYKYTVNVTNGTTTLSLDPIIINGASL